MIKQSEKTLEQLKNKASSMHNRMPNIKRIHTLLEELGIEHQFRESQHVCETKSKGNKYVNSRWDGKEGYKLSVNNIELDTSTSYYSVNSYFRAQDILELIAKKECEIK